MSVRRLKAYGDPTQSRSGAAGIAPSMVLPMRAPPAKYVWLLDAGRMSNVEAYEYGTFSAEITNTPSSMLPARRSAKLRPSEVG